MTWPVLAVVVAVIIQTPDHAKGKLIGFVFRIRPKNIMAHLVINRVNPLSFRIVFSALFPVLRVNQIDLSVFIGLAGGSPPIDVLIPFYPGILQMIEATESSDGFFKILRLVVMKK